MMRTNEAGKAVGRDTTMCGDPKIWCQLRHVIATGYADNMDEELANELLDDIDYHFNKVKCRKIEVMMPRLMNMVESEMKIWYK